MTFLFGLVWFISVNFLFLFGWSPWLLCLITYVLIGYSIWLFLYPLVLLFGYSSMDASFLLHLVWYFSLKAHSLSLSVCFSIRLLQLLLLSFVVAHLSLMVFLIGFFSVGYDISWFSLILYFESYKKIAFHIFNNKSYFLSKYFSISPTLNTWITQTKVFRSICQSLEIPPKRCQNPKIHFKWFLPLFL